MTSQPIERKDKLKSVSLEEMIASLENFERGINIKYCDFITDQDIKSFFKIGHTSDRPNFIHTNSPNDKPDFSKILVRKPCYKHQEPSFTSSRESKVIFILSDYILYEPEGLKGINYNFYQHVLSVAYKVFLWKGTPEYIKEIKPKKIENLYQRPIVQYKHAINIEQTRPYLSLPKDLHDIQIEIITAKDRIRAIQSIFGPTYQKNKLINPYFFKLNPEWKLPQPTIIVGSKNHLLDIKSRDSGDDISFKHLTVSLETEKDIAKLFKFIGSDNLIEHVHFEQVALEHFDMVLKHCPKVKTISLIIRLDEKNIKLFESLPREISKKIVSVHICSVLQDENLLHVAKLTHLINLKRLTLSSHIDLRKKLSLPASLKYLNFFDCFYIHEDISPSLSQTFISNIEKTHPDLIIEIFRGISNKRLGFVARSLTSEHKLFKKLSCDDFGIYKISPQTCDDFKPDKTSPQTNTQAIHLHLARTGPISTSTQICQTRFYTEDTDIKLPDARMDQDSIMKLAVREDKDKKQIGFVSAATHFIPIPNQKNFYCSTYDQYSSHEQYLALQKKLNLSKAVCGRVDATMLQGDSIYILPTPYANRQQYWELATIAFEPPDFADHVEIGCCLDLENIYALRLKDAKSAAQTFKAHMVLCLTDKALCRKAMPPTLPVKSEIYPTLQWLACSPNIQTHFPNFSQLISALNRLQQQKTQLRQQDPHFEAESSSATFSQIIQAQLELLEEYCTVGKGFKVGAENVDWHKLLEPTNLKLLAQYDGLKELLNNVLTQQGECRRAAESFVFLATGYDLLTWMISNPTHDYVKTLSPIVKNKPELDWITRDLGGAPREYKNTPFFPEQQEKKSTPADEAKSLQQQSFSSKPTVVELQPEPHFPSEEFRPFQSRSAHCHSVTEFVTMVLAQTAPLVTYPASDPNIVEGFLTALCDYFRSQHQQDSKGSSPVRSAPQIMQALTEHSPSSSPREDSALSCWIKLVEHPDELDALWEAQTIRDSQPIALKTPLQNQIPTLVIVNISAFDIDQLEVHANLLQPSPSLLYQSRLFPLPTSCRIIYLCNDAQLAIYDNLTKELQDLSWPQALNADFIKISAAIPLNQQLQDDTSQPHSADLKSPTIVPDALIYDLTKVEPSSFLMAELQINDGKITLKENPAANALKENKPLTIHHVFDSKTATIFRHTALRTLVWERQILQQDQWTLLPPYPQLVMAKQPINWPTRLREIPNCGQWLAWRNHETVTAYTLNSHTYPHFIRNWQADIKTQTIISTNLPGILSTCKTALALIEVTDFMLQSDWFALYQEIEQLPESVEVAIYFHPNYRQAPDLEQARQAPKMKAESDAKTFLKPKVFFAANSDLFGALDYLKTDKHLPEDILVIPINADSTQEELFETFIPDLSGSLTDKNGHWRIQHNKPEVMTFLKQGKSVLLMGAISAELYTASETCILSDYLWSNAQRLTLPGQLYLLSPPNPQLTKHLTPFFDTQPIAVKQTSFLQWPDSSPLIADTTKSSATDEDKKQSIADNVQQVLTLLQQHKSLTLLGSSGTGKTFTALTLIPNALEKMGKPYRLYTGEGSIEPWLKADHPGVIHILVLDEVNILPSDFLQPLIQPDGKRFWRSKAYAHQEEHWLIGTGNPRLSYSGRHPLPVGMPTLWFQPFTHDDIYRFQIAPFLEHVMKITDTAMRKTLADVYLDGYNFVREQVLVSPRNLNRILSHCHALQAQYAAKNTIPAPTELLTSWMRHACYLEFNSLLTAYNDQEQIIKFHVQLAAALQLKQPLKLSIPAKMRSQLLKKNIVPTQPIINLAHYLQTALQIRRNTLKHQLMPSNYGILLQSADTKSMRECVKVMLADKNLAYMMLAINPQDEMGFKKSVRQSLQQKTILILENPHLITPALEKWLNPLLEGMDVEQENPIPFLTEFYVIFLHHERKPLPTPIKNRLQFIQIETCTEQDWRFILQQYTQNAARIDLVASSFAILLQEHARLDKAVLRNPGDLSKLCERLKENQWFEQTTSLHRQWFHLHQTLMVTFCLRWSAAEQECMHDKLKALQSQWLKKYSVEEKSMFKLPEKKMRLIGSNYYRFTALDFYHCIDIGEELCRNKEFEQATLHFDLAKRRLQESKIINLEVWKKLRQAYYNTRSDRNHLELVKQNLHSALAIDEVIARRGEKSIKPQIQQALKECQINTPHVKENDSCLVM